jgi:hypothetical protein
VGVKYNAGSDVFEPVIDELLPHRGVIGEIGLQKIASKLVHGLLELGWDNADGTLGLYDDSPAIVAAFKENGVLLFCGAEHPDDGESCEGAERGHTEPHRDHLGRTWTDQESVT